MESVQGVRRGDVVWQVRPLLVGLVVKLWSCRSGGVLMTARAFALDSCGALLPLALVSLITVHPSAPFLLQIGFGSGFKCNSVVWKALRPIKTVHQVGVGWCSACLPAAG